MITVYVRHPDGRYEELSSLVEAARVARLSSDTRLWIDLEEPDEWTLALLGEAFTFHPLAIEDCLHGEQRSRIDPYDGYIFMIVYGPVLNERNEFTGSRELAIFCSPQYIVTLHHLTLPSLEAMRPRCRRDPENVLGRGMDHLLHMLVDGVIDAYQPVLDRMEDEATELEDTALTDPRAEIMERISSIRSELLQVRRYLLPLRESIGQLARGEYAFIGKHIRPYFRDVLDHLVRTVEMLDFYRDQIAGAREVYMSSLSQRTNETMKTLTIFATIMLPLTLVTGIYGMNFQFLWPPADEPFGFWIVLGVMSLLASVLLYFFRRWKWL